MNREILDVREFFNRLAPYYDLIYDKKLKEKTKQEIAFIQSLLSKEGKILDIACGTGRHTIELKRVGYDVIGVDISEKMLHIAKNKKYNKFIQANIQKLPIITQSVDMVICLFSSFCHLLTQQEQQKAINEIYRVLKSQGVVVIDVANWTWLQKQWERKGKKIGIVPDTHRVAVHLEDRYIDKPLRTKLYHYTIEDLSSLFNIFTQVKFYGSFSLNDRFDEQNSERIVSVAYK
jgi:ubiquinone/menaquinone biosynthesis C-methylase UbiE